MVGEEPPIAFIRDSKFGRHLGRDITVTGDTDKQGRESVWNGETVREGIRYERVLIQWRGGGVKKRKLRPLSRFG